MVYQATVCAAHAGTYVIQVKSSNSEARQAFWLPQVMSTFIGVKTAFIPTVGSTVLCFDLGTQTYALGIPTEIDGGVPVYPIRVAQKTGAVSTNELGADIDIRNAAEVSTVNQSRPVDLFSGEHSIGNEFGILMHLAQALTQLKGSELAQIQCFMFDDLVRIISHNFSHYHAMGEFNITHDGKRLMMEGGLTHIPQEALGIAKTENINEGEAVFEQKESASFDDKQDFYELKSENLQAIERLRYWIGGVGDFFNLILCSPEKAILNEYGKNRERGDLGLFQTHLGTDGGLRVRSAKEIFLEKTNWIRVPRRVRKANDPEGNREEEDNVEKKKFVFDKTFTDTDIPSSFALQLYDYGTYLNEYFAYLNFKTQNKDFEVESNYEKSLAKNIRDIKKVDPWTHTDYIPTQSGLYLMPNGGMVLKDAWGSAIVMEGGNIYLQPKKDLVMQPLRNLLAKVGSWLHVQVRKHVDISVTKGSMRLKTKKTQHFYSKDEGILFQSDSTTPSEFVPENSTSFGQKLSGIAILAKTGIYNYAKEILNLSTHKTIVKSARDVRVFSDQTASVHGNQSANVTGRSVSVVSENNTQILSTSGSTALAGRQSTSVGESGRSLNIDISQLKDGEGKSISGQVRGTGSSASGNVTLNLYQQDPQTDLDIFQNYSSLQTITFKFPTSADYGVTEQDFIPQTLAQQYAALLNTDLETWEEEEINNTYPYPGENRDKFVVSEVKNINTNGVVKTEDLSFESKLILASIDNQYKVLK